MGLRARANWRVRDLDPDSLAELTMPQHRLVCAEGLSGFFMWEPSAAVSREPSVPAFGLHQRLTSNVVLQQ